MWIVQEFVAHKWFTVRSFANEHEATAFAANLGRNARVIKIAK